MPFPIRELTQHLIWGYPSQGNLETYKAVTGYQEKKSSQTPLSLITERAIC